MVRFIIKLTNVAATTKNKSTLAFILYSNMYVDISGYISPNAGHLPAVITVTGELFVLEHGSSSLLLSLTAVTWKSWVIVKDGPVHAHSVWSWEVTFDQRLQNTSERGEGEREERQINHEIASINRVSSETGAQLLYR